MPHPRQVLYVLNSVYRQEVLKEGELSLMQLLVEVQAVVKPAVFNTGAKLEVVQSPETKHELTLWIKC